MNLDSKVFHIVTQPQESAMNRRLHIHIGRLALPALVGALSGLCALPALAAITDIANAPLASSSNLSVKPNLLFILDDSGSMTMDAMPDNAEPQQAGSERKYWDTMFNCKWRVGHHRTATATTATASIRPSAQPSSMGCITTRR